MKKKPMGLSLLLVLSCALMASTAYADDNLGSVNVSNMTGKCSCKYDGSSFTCKVSDTPSMPVWLLDQNCSFATKLDVGNNVQAPYVKCSNNITSTPHQATIAVNDEEGDVVMNGSDVTSAAIGGDPTAYVIEMDFSGNKTLVIFAKHQLDIDTCTILYPS